jgi:hypothetical protein
MPLVLADRVKETTTTTGTGTITLDGAATGFQSFSAVGNGNTTYYTIAGQGTNEWEVGVGTYTASGTTLSRDTVLSSSAGAPTKTNFSAGTKDVFVTYPSERAVYSDGTNIVPDNPAILLPPSGGTGRSSVASGSLLIGAGTSAMTELAGSTPGQAVIWNGAAWAAGTAGAPASIVNAYVSPATWTKPADLKQVKVTVVAAGGAGGSIPSANPAAASGGGSGGSAIRWIPAPTIPGPVAVTAGPGTNSFGAFASATVGGNGAISPAGIGGTGGTGTSGTININGNRGGSAFSVPGQSYQVGGAGAPSILGVGGGTVTGGLQNGNPGTGYGAGGGGAVKQAPGASTGGTGAPGIVIVEEFY